MTKAWPENKPIILGYYQAKNMSLTQVIKEMKKHHNFEASPRAFRQMFKQWNVRKYNRKDNVNRVVEAEPGTKRLQSSASHHHVSRFHRPLYVTSPPMAAQDTPRPAHAHIAGRVDDQYSGMVTPATYVDDSLVSSALLLASHDQREQYHYPRTRHAMSQDSMASNTRSIGEEQKIGCRESPPMVLHPTTESSSPDKTTPWQQTYRQPYGQQSTLDSADDRFQNTAFRRTPMDWHAGQMMGRKFPDDHFSETTTAVPSTHHENTPYKYQSPPVKHASTAGFAEYGSEYQSKPYGSPVGEQTGQSQFYPKQSSTKHDVWGISAIATGSSSAYKTQSYHLPSPPHAQAHLSLSAAKALDEQTSSIKASPLSPSSQPDMSLQGHETVSVYPSEVLPATMAYARVSDAYYDTATSSPGSASTPSLSSSVASPSAVSAHSHHTMYSPYQVY